MNERGSVLLTIVLLALLGVTPVLAAERNSTPTTIAGIDLNAPVSGELKTEVLKEATVAAKTAHLSTTVAAREIARLASMSPTEIARAAGVSPSILRPLSCSFLSAGSCLGLGVSILGSCAVGAILGSGGGPVGAGVGCVVSALTGAAIYNFATLQGIVQNVQGNTFTQWAQANIAAASNDWNLTDLSFRNLASALNFSLVAFERMADSAAVLQLANSTFNSAQDLFQSGIAAQLSTIGMAYSYQFAQPYTILNQWAQAQISGAGAYQSVAAKFCTPLYDTGATCIRPNGVNPALTVANLAAGGTTIGATCTLQSNCNATFYIPPNTTAIYTSATSAPSNLLVHPVLGSGWTTISPTNTTYVYNSGSGTVYTLYAYKSTYNAGYYQLSRASGTSSGFTAPGLTMFPASDNKPVTGLYAQQGMQQIGYFGGSTYNGTGGGYNSATDGQYFTLAGATVTYTIHPFALVTAQNFAAWLGHIMYQASANAQTYWSFLRSLGYTTIGQIPINCVIPAPWQVLPSQLNLGNLTQSQLTSLYMAWLIDEGRFYNNTNLSTTHFCGNSKQVPFNVTQAIWTNLGINSSGYLYLNNGTSPVNINGTRLGSENFANLSTWAVQKRQLMLMPTLKSVAIPLGVKWLVPADNPIEVFVVQLGILATLFGNGTYPFSPEVQLSVEPLGTLSPGSAVYLTSCTIYGNAANNCTVTVQTIQTQTVNLTCLGSGKNSPASCQSQAPPSTTAGFWGIGNPLQALANWLASLFGGGPLGQLIGSVLSILLPLIVIAVLAYVAIVELEAWGNGKTRSGGSGGPSSRAIGGFRRRPPGRTALRWAKGSAHVTALMVFGFVLMGVGFIIALLDGIVNLTGPALLVFGLVVIGLGIVADTYGAETRKR